MPKECKERPGRHISVGGLHQVYYLFILAQLRWSCLRLDGPVASGMVNMADGNVREHKQKKNAYFVNSNEKRGMKSSSPTIPFKVKL